MADQENPVEETAELPETDPTPKREVMVAPVWPRDQYGITSALRRELARTVGRINGDDAKMAVFMDTLRVGAHWAVTRLEIQKRARERVVAAVNEREKELNAAQEELNAELSIKTDAERAADQRDAGVLGAVTSKV